MNLSLAFEIIKALENIHKHTTHEGFIGLKATDPVGNLLGFSYGYRSLPGQFYREKLEKKVTQEQAGHWLKDCFEFVELAVDPSHKRMGVGSSLHDKTIIEVLNATSVLTTSIGNTPSLTLYKSKGWIVIKEDARLFHQKILKLFWV